MARLEKLGVEQRTPPCSVSDTAYLLSIVRLLYGGLVTCADEVCETAARSGFPWPEVSYLAFVLRGQP
jgi:hypothetical protein